MVLRKRSILKMNVKFQVGVETGPQSSDLGVTGEKWKIRFSSKCQG